MKKILVFVLTSIISLFVLFYAGKTAREDFASANYSAKMCYTIYGDGRYDIPDTFTGNAKLGAIELFGEDYREKSKEQDVNIEFPEIPTEEIVTAIDDFGKYVGRGARKISK